MITRRDFIKITAATGALASVGRVEEAKAAIEPALPDVGMALEGERKIPLMADVDIVVAGGSSRAVAAAVAAAKKGCRVFLVAYMPYLGDDICGSFLYDKKDDEVFNTAIAEKIFFGSKYPLPLHVKKVLEDELIDNGVDFLYSSYVTNVLTDESDHTRGVVIANRSGRQAIRAKAIIDATHTATVAELYGAQFSPFKTGVQSFVYTVVGNKPQSGSGIEKVETLSQPFDFKGKKYPVTRYTISHEMKDNSYASLMEVEQKARSLTWDPDQVDSSDLLWYIPSQHIVSEKRYEGSDLSLRKISEQTFIPKGIENIWVLGPCADMSREVAENNMRPIQAMFLGELLGEIVAGKAKALTVSIMAPKVKHTLKQNAFNYGRVGEVLKPLRSVQSGRAGSVSSGIASSGSGNTAVAIKPLHASLTPEFVVSDSGSLPVIGSYDVVVLGGGTAGAVAGLSSAKYGAKTLVLEYLHGLGGLTTLGLIGRYWDGFRGGFSYTIDKSVTEMAPKDHPRQLKDWEAETQSDWKQEWYRRELLNAKGELWFGVLGCGALVEDNKVKGVVVATPFGRGIVLSKVLIDSTGSADIAIAAGAEFDYTGKKTLAVQGAGMGKMDPGDFYCNNDWLFIDDTDILDVSRVFVQSKEKFRNHYDMVKIPQTRERRRVVGEHVISVYDVLHHRRYPDTISYHKSSFDTHGMIVDPYFILSPPLARHTIYDADVPLRSLLPKGLDGILTTGLGASAHRDAMPVIRMQPCLQNQGYAVGYLSATAIKEGRSIRKVDIKKIQKHLVSIGNLPERVLKDKEFKGFSNSEMKTASISVTDNYKGLEILLTDPERCTKLILEQIKTALSFDDKVVYASILCILGDATYSSILKEKISQYKAWDKGWHYTGMHQFGMSLSQLDAYIIALGRAKDASSLDVVLDKAKMLVPEDYFSHFRAISMATESINSREAISVLAEMLTTPGVRGHSVNTYAEARSQTVPNDIDVTFRNKALKELHLARALYVCGDKDGLGKEVLMRYATSLQGHYARYADEILSDTDILK